MIVNVMTTRKHNTLTSDSLFDVEVTVDHNSKEDMVVIGYDGKVTYAQFDRIDENSYLSKARALWKQHDQANKVWNAASKAASAMVEENMNMFDSIIEQRRVKGVDEAFACWSKEACDKIHEKLSSIEA